MKCHDRMCGADDCLNCHPEAAWPKPKFKSIHHPHRPAMKHLNAIVAYHMIENAKAVMHGESESGSAQRMVMPQHGEPRMIEVRHDGQMQVTSPATLQEIEKAIADDINKRVEIMRLAQLGDRLKQLEIEAEKARIQRLERDIPTNAA
jgi:hypothetical protein